MEKRLIQAKPVRDTAALLVIAFPFVEWLVSDVPETFELSLKIILLVSTLLISYRAATLPHNPHLESKSAKRSGKQRSPLMWTLVVRGYLYLMGDRSLVRPSSALHASKSSNTQVTPQIRYAGASFAGVILPHPSSLRFYVNDVPWSQVYASNDQGIAILFGLRANTLYTVKAVSIDIHEADHNKAHTDMTAEFYICTTQSSYDSFTSSTSSPSSSVLPNLLSTSSSSSPAAALPASSAPPLTGTNTSASVDDSVSRPRRRVDVYSETLESIITTLNDEKARLRKFRKDCLKKLSGMRHEIDSLSTKLVTKRKSDERSRKRIQALRDRVAQQKLELAELEKQSQDSAKSAEEVSKLVNKVEEAQREQQSKQQGLDVSVRVWAELQRTKHNEVCKLEQRCTKLADRLEKVQTESSANEYTKLNLVADFIQQLKSERNARKQRRVRLEADFKTAIAKLGSI